MLPWSRDLRRARAPWLLLAAVLSLTDGVMLSHGRLGDPSLSNLTAGAFSHALAKVHAHDDHPPEVLVITVPHREQSEWRMLHIRRMLQQLNLSYALVDGPNAERYCPVDINKNAQSKAAGKELLLKEWHGRMPDLSKYDLHLFQIATLVGHMRAWQRIADTGHAAVVLEDDADITSGEDLKWEVQDAGVRGVDVKLLDPRHCLSGKPPHLIREAYGMTGYWLDAKAAKAFLAHTPLDIPIDWGVNDVLNRDVVAECSVHGPAREFGGLHYARLHSAFHACNRTSLSFLQVHPVAALLQAHEEHIRSVRANINR